MLAPILITVYNRINHLKRTIEALKKNDLASESILYIASDAPNKKEDENEIKKIREFIKTIEGFKEIKLIERDINFGSYKSTKLAIEDILNRYGKLIFLEDDINVSEYFLEYMNKGLETFENENEIFAICSYSPPNLNITGIKEDIYLWNYYCPWGVAIWEKKWKKLDLELAKYPKFFKDKRQVFKFFKGANHVLPILIEDREKKIIAMDARIDFNMFINNWYCVYPLKSLSKNIGVDGSGEHSGEDKKYQNQRLENWNPKVESEIIFYKRIFEKRKKYHQFKFLKRVYTYLKIFDLSKIFDKIGLTKILKKIENRNI